MALGTKLKLLLIERGMTVKEFADKIQVPATTLYSFITRDSNNAKLDLLQKICTGLDIPLEQLLCDDELHMMSDSLEYQIHNLSNSLVDSEEKELLLNEYNEELNEVRQIIELNQWLKCQARQSDYNKTKLLQSYDLLNSDGQDEAVKRIQELTEIKRYTKPNNNKSK